MAKSFLTSLQLNGNSILNGRVDARWSATPSGTTNPDGTGAAVAGQISSYAGALYVYSGSAWTALSTGAGTVTSVTGTSPVVSSGGTTPAISLAANYGDTLNPYAAKTANYVLAAPNGSSAAPTFRALVAADIPTLNQSTTGSAAKWTSAVNLAGNSVDGSASVAFSNKFIVQGTTDAGLTGAQFLGALGTGILKNTTSTGVLSIASAGDFPTLNQNTTGSAGSATTAANLSTTFGTVPQLLVQSATNTTTLIATGTLGQVLIQGSGGPAYSSTPVLGTLASLTTSGDVTVGGNLTVNGTTTTINSTTITVDDKNLELGSVASPTDTTADGAGITVKGATDKTFNWVGSTTAWTSSEDLNLLTGKSYEIAGTSVLNATTLGSGVVSSSLTSVGTIATGTWNGTAIAGQYGGTGVANTGKTITLGGNLTTSGAFTTTLTATANTSVTLPTTGTLVNTAVATLSSLASVGTITTGVWNGTAIGLLYGGTGATTAAAARTNLGATTKVTAAGSGSGTSIAVAHGLGTAVIAQLLDNTGAVVEVDVVTTATASGTTTFTFSSTQTLSNFTYVIIG
jgi:hypothetical protein